MIRYRTSFALLASFTLAFAGAVAAPISVPYQEGMRITLGQGHDLAKIAAAALKVPGRTSFETDVEYSARVNDFMAKPVYGSVHLSDRIVLTAMAHKVGSFPDGFAWSFSPDDETVQLVAATDGKFSALDIDAPEWLEVWSDSREVSRGSYVGTNALGAQVKVSQRRYREVRALVRVPGGIARFKTDSGPLSRAEAPAALSIPPLVIIARLVPPYAKRGPYVTKPTIRRPVDESIDLTELYFEAQEIRLHHAISNAVLVKKVFGQPESSPAAAP